VEKFTQQERLAQMDACSILSFEDPVVLFVTDYMVCTKQVDQGPDFRTAVKNAY